METIVSRNETLVWSEEENVTDFMYHAVFSFLLRAISVFFSILQEEPISLTSFPFNVQIANVTLPQTSSIHSKFSFFH